MTNSTHTRHATSFTAAHSFFSLLFLLSVTLFTAVGKASAAHLHFYGLFGFLYMPVCFLGILRCILHALLAGLLIKLCLQAIPDECVFSLLTFQCLKSFL